MIDAQRIADANEAQIDPHRSDFEHLGEVLTRSGGDTEALVASLARFSVACPSWAMGTGSTRFGRFPIGGEPRSTEEKIEDVSALNSLTGANRDVSLHVPWDDPQNPEELASYAREQRIGFDAMNSNTFQDNPGTTAAGRISYKFGSLCHTDAEVRKAAIEHNRYVINLGAKLGSKAITIWLADGTSYPGQADFRGQFERVLGSLREIYNAMPEAWRLFTEHKPYEPAFYSSVNNDWGSSLLLAQGVGERALCLVDLGHHLPNCNIEQVVSRLAMAGKLGGFHFNDSKYGDDDLTAGAIKPYQLFLIFVELLAAGGGELPSLAYMLDQSHNLKDPIEDLIQATDALHIALAQALCLDRTALAEAQRQNDPALAQDILHRAYRTDVRPLVAEARLRNGAAIDPLATYRAAGYRAAKIAERGASTAATGL
jgi:L-rhamnose isomerase/sugar isomerase